MYVGLGIDPEGQNGCLTRIDGGLFAWNAATLNKLGEADLQAKQVKFVCCMLHLMYDLMLDMNANVQDVPFQPFIGRTMNLQK